MRDQERLHRRAMQAAERIAKSKGMDVNDVVTQLDAEARRRGAIRPMPGKDI